MIFIKNIFNICFVIIGTIIGAGFASGKEIYSFFCVYGIYGLFGLLVSNLIIGLVIFMSFIIISRNNIKTYSEFINFLVNNKKILSYSITNIMNIFLLISFIVMCAGFGAYFLQEFNLPVFFGAIVISVLAFITFFNNINGIIKINSILIPILILLVILLGYKCNIMFFKPFALVTSSNYIWIIKSILYASYNSIMLVPILINLRNFIKKEKDIKIVAFFTMFFMIIMSVIIYIILCINMPMINEIDIPIVYIANSFGVVFKLLYGFVILTAIFTTATSSGFSFLNNVAKNKKQYFTFSILMCSVAVCFSNIGFSNLLNLLYPILGFLGLIQIGLLLFSYDKL